MRISLVTSLLLATSAASAQDVRVCVSVESGDRAASAAALARLVRAEIDAHPGHRATDDACDQHLHVELFAIDGRRTLTGRLGGLVPERVRAERGALDEAVVELVSVLLHNDPLRLDRPGSDANALRRLRRARSGWGIRLEQRLGWLARSLFALPGVAVYARRELPRWSIGALLGADFRMSPSPRELHPRLIARLAFAVGWATSRTAEHVGAFGFHLGLMHLWVNGPLDGDPSRNDDAFGTGPYVGLSAGAELFRTTATRLAISLAVDLPLFLVRDEIEAVVRSWVPTVALGATLFL